jgi:hypothetical protein
VSEQLLQLDHGLQVPSTQLSQLDSAQEATSDFGSAGQVAPPCFGTAFTALLLRFVPPPQEAVQSPQDSQSAHSQSTLVQLCPVKQAFASSREFSHGREVFPVLTTTRIRKASPMPQPPLQSPHSVQVDTLQGSSSLDSASHFPHGLVS